MSREFSKAAQNYPPSGIRKMFDLATQYPDAIKLTVGEPNFDTPAYIKEAAKKAMDAGETHYTPNAGMPVLRRAVAEKHQKSHWDGYTADHVMVTVGAMEGLIRDTLPMAVPLHSPPNKKKHRSLTAHVFSGWKPLWHCKSVL